MHKTIWKSPAIFLNKGGADSNEKAQENFYNTLTQSYQKDYGNFEDLTKSLMDTIQPIINAGPDQYGFSKAEDSTLRSTAENSDAVAAQNAQIAANKQIVAANGGSSTVPTGAEEELKQQADVAAAQKLASDEQTISKAGYEKGYQTWQTALGQEDTALGLEDPTRYAGAATEGGNAATNAVNAATQADSGWMSMVGSALGGAASVFSGAGTAALGLDKAKPPCWIAAELYGGWNDWRTCKIRFWLATRFQEHWYGRLFMRWYFIYGERTAKYIKTHKKARKAAQFVFDRFLRAAEKWNHNAEN